MLKKMFIWVVFLCVVPSLVYAASSAFEISNDTLVFPDGSVLATAPKDGKSILNGSGAPAGIVGNVGDFYIDTANNKLYGPYAGAWGYGVSLMGPQGLQGPKGDTGAQGVQGPAGTCTASPATVMNYMTSPDWIAIAGTTDVTQILSTHGYPSGIIFGSENNIGLQLTSGTSNGLVVFYFLKYLPTGNIDSSFTPLIIAGGQWTSTTINGKSAILVNASSVRYGMPDIYFTEMNGNIVVGEVMPGPASPMAKTISFATNMVSNKTVSITLPNGTTTLYLASNGLASGTKQDGEAFSNIPWAINSDGTLTIGSLTLKIVGGSANPWSVTYVNASYSAPVTELGPITMLIK